MISFQKETYSLFLLLFLLIIVKVKSDRITHKMERRLSLKFIFLFFSF
jgi:hypothetical protein